MICAVVFQPQGRLYYADPGELRPPSATTCCTRPTRAPRSRRSCGRRSGSARTSAACRSSPGSPTTADPQAAETSRKKRAAARVAATPADPRARPADEGQPASTTSPATNHTTIYFTAPHRVDFRGLVRDLAATLNGRVELRQLSARDEARLTGGIGSCGRELCCSTFLVDFEPVSVRMAKDQDLPLNPLRISGACGRLMCCLKYEHPLYQEFAEKAPGDRARRRDAGRRRHGSSGTTCRARRSSSGWRRTAGSAAARSPRCVRRRKAYESR